MVSPRSHPWHGERRIGVDDYSADCDCGCGILLRSRRVHQRVRRLPGHRDDTRRYVVIGVHGYSDQGSLGTSYSVCDRAYNSREVATFYAKPKVQDRHRLAAAQTLCASLNADERAWEVAG